MPNRPWHEIVVALAGPAVNVVIAAGILAGVVAGSIVLPLRWTPHEMGPAEVFLGRLFWANAVLCAFNLIPAFPMDGGRVLRALLSTGMSRLDATRAAVTVGSVLAVVGGAYGLLAEELTLVLVSVVVFLLGQAELTAVKAQAFRDRARERVADFFGAPADADDGRRDDRFTGWTWDPVRRVWGEWRSGVLLREIPAV
jgi:Zn-dependent protease